MKQTVRDLIALQKATISYAKHESLKSYTQNKYLLIEKLFRMVKTTKVNECQMICSKKKEKETK